jgi:N-hydroxyarylamine O-acetyltransferase
MTPDLDAYMRRIDYAGPLRADLATLTALHRAHLMAVPYENLDVQLGRPLNTDPNAAFEKIVGRGRGGWCYEMNGAFGLVLEAIGFAVTRIAGEASRPGSHLALTVDLGGMTYVCDVGFSDGPLEPYPLIEGPFSRGGFEFRLERLEGRRWRFHNHRYGAAGSFEAEGPDEALMAETCAWLQASPESVFVQHAVLVRRHAGGFVKLIDRSLIEVTPEAGIVGTTVIASADELVATLKSRFGLDLPEAAALWPALCAQHETYLATVAARKADEAAS